MRRTGYNSKRVLKNQDFELKKVTSLSVSNYSPQGIRVIIQDVSRPVPALPASNVPYIFTIDGDGTASDINIRIEFDNKIGLAILDYREEIDC